MKEISLFFLVILCVYLLFALYLHLFQRKLIYYPTSVDPGFSADGIRIDNDGVLLKGWVLNPGNPKALTYFGGNSEMITHRREYFETVFSDYSVYLINYRGYGASQGIPTETGLFSDALAIYDELVDRHDSITAYGRSLGSGVAVYLAANRKLEKLILLTPYDSVASVAQSLYPVFPIRYLIKDRFDSVSRAGMIDIPVLIASAENDREIRLHHTLALKQSINPGLVTYQMIPGAAHNNIIDFPQYRKLMQNFLQEWQLRPGDS